MRCPSCDRQVMQIQNGTIRFRIDGPVEMTGKAAKSRCYWCKADVGLPIQLKMEEIPEVEPPPGPRLVLRRKKKLHKEVDGPK